MSTPRVESVKWQNGDGSQHMSGTSHTLLTSLPPVAGYFREANNHARRHVSKCPELSRCSGLHLSSSLPDCREMKLPDLTETQMMTSRRPPPARAAAAAQRVEDPQMKHWSSELPAYHRRSWRQSTDSISQAHPAVSVWSENGRCQSDTIYQQPTLRKSSSTGGPLIDASTASMTAKKSSFSMYNLTDKQPMVIIL